MGDHRLRVEITLMGMDGDEAKIDWWLNWSANKPELLYRDLVAKARSVGLEVDDKTFLFDDA
jgi:hypothetical protein